MADEVVNIFDEVNKQADIVKVVSHYLGASALTRKGNVYYSLCPFHKDSHPSFRIDPQRNTAKCFSCGVGANPISFVEKHAHLKPMEALKKVCVICNIPLPSQVKSYREKPDPIAENYKDELAALGELTKFYQMTLLSNDGKKGRDYLEQRKLPKEAIEKFHIGYAPNDTHASINTLRKLNFEVKTLERAGILSGGADLKDRYQERIMFPLEDLKGRIVGFSGRTIESHSEAGKYINYPTTPLFNKSDVLYHFAAAREIARKNGYLYIVEGFMDVIAFCRAGEEAVCGVMGTALTKEHCEVISRLGVEVRLCLDRDEAGQSNEERCIALFHQYKIPCRIVRRFRSGKDADEVLSKMGPAALLEEANRMYDPFLFLLGRALRGRKTLLDPAEITTFLHNAALYFLDLPELSQANDLKILSNVTTFDPETLRRILHHEKTQTEMRAKDQKPKENAYRYRSYKRDRKDIYQGPAIFSNISNPGTIVMEVTHNILSLMEEYVRENGIFSAMFKTESEIICALPFARESAASLSDNNIDLSIKIYYALSTAFSDFFRQNQKKESLTPEDFQEIYHSLTADETSASSEEAADFDGLFFFDDLDDGKRGFGTLDKLDEKEKRLAASVLNEIMKLKPEYIDSDNLRRNIERESKLLQINNLLANSKRENGGNVDAETKAKIQTMIRQFSLHLKIKDIF